MTTPEAAVTVADAAAPAGEIAASPAQLRRRVLGLAAPVIGENMLQTLLGVVDTVLVAGLGVVALAGVGAALQVIFIVVAALSALSIGASVLVAQAVGAQNLGESSRLARQALVWSLVVSVPVTAFGLAFSAPIIALFGLEPDVARVAEEYLHVTIGTVFTLVVMLICGGVMRGAGNSRTPMLVTLLANVVNIGVSYALIYGHAGLPALGAVGSAWGTFLSRLLGAALLVAALWRGINGVRVAGRSGWRPQGGVARRVLGIGLPAALEEVIIISAFAALTPIVAALGTVSLAAHRVVLNVLSLSFLPGIGFGLAATALVGQCVGAGNLAEARAVTRIAARWCVVWMGGLALLFLLFAPQLMRLFTADPQMIAAGALSIQLVALTQPLWAGTFVFGGALRGAGDTRTPLVISGVLMWAVVAFGVLAVRLWPALAAVWATFLLAAPVEVACLWWAWRRLSRRHMEAVR